MKRRRSSKIEYFFRNKGTFDCKAGSDKQCRKVDYKYMYFTEYLITRADVNDFMAHRPEYTKANRFEDFVCKIYL